MMRIILKRIGRTNRIIGMQLASISSAVNLHAWLMLCLLLAACHPSDDKTGQTKAAVSTLSQPVVDIVDTNPDPKVFEAELSVDEQDVLIGGVLVHAIIYKDVNSPGRYVGTPNGIPVPQFAINVGDEVVVKLKNDLEPGCAAMHCDTSIHWHGLELDND